MSLVRLTYVSRVVDGSLSATENILEKSNDNNHANGVTGVLYFNLDFFIQCLEGSAERVNATLAHIMKDRRHTDLKVLATYPVSNRMFEAWTMAYVSGRLPGYEQCDPYAMGMSETNHLLKALQKQVFATHVQNLRGLKF
ncbi:BLUF domain-containing protein [Vibrio paucivorans]